MRKEGKKDRNICSRGKIKRSDSDRRLTKYDGDVKRLRNILRKRSEEKRYNELE